MNGLYIKLDFNLWVERKEGKKNGGNKKRRWQITGSTSKKIIGFFFQGPFINCELKVLPRVNHIFLQLQVAIDEPALNKKIRNHLYERFENNNKTDTRDLRITIQFWEGIFSL